MCLYVSLCLCFFMEMNVTCVTLPVMLPCLRQLPCSRGETVSHLFCCLAFAEGAPSCGRVTTHTSSRHTGHKEKPSCLPHVFGVLCSAVCVVESIPCVRNVQYVVLVCRCQQDGLSFGISHISCMHVHPMLVQVSMCPPHAYYSSASATMNPSTHR